MKLRVTDTAANWLKHELDLKNGDWLRFYVMLYGNAYSIHSNYSLGMSKEEPRHASIQTETEGIHFYLEDQDKWYLDEHNLIVDLDSGEIKFQFEPLIPS